MGNWYEFTVKEVDGRKVFGFLYCNKDTAWQDVFVEMTDEQADTARKWLKKEEDLFQEQKELIKSWIKGQDKECN